MFDRKGVLILERTQERSEDDVMMAAIEAGAEDFTAYEENYEILTAPADLGAVREALEGQGYTFVSSELEYLPQNTVAMDPETQEALDKLIENLEDLDDVQNVYHNGEEA